MSAPYTEDNNQVSNNQDSNGWIKVYRSSLDSACFSNPNIWYVWSWILLKANYKTTKFLMNGQEIILQPGEFITGRNAALRELPGLSLQRFRTALKSLNLTKQITIKTTNKYTIISITNWDRFQSANQQTNQPVTNKQPTNNQQITTYKNIITKESNKGRREIEGEGTLTQPEKILIPEIKIAQEQKQVLEVIDDPDYKIANELLENPDGSKPFEATAAFMNAGRRPMKKYPTIFVSVPELGELVRLLKKNIPKPDWPRVFKKVETRINQKLTEGMSPDRLPTPSWLTGWAYQDVLNEVRAETYLQKAKEPYVQN